MRGMNYNIEGGLVEEWVDNNLPTKKRKERVAFCVLVANLVAAKGLWIAYTRDTSRKPVKRYNKHLIGARQVVACVLSLQEGGWIENVNGVAHPREEERTVSTMRATKKLLSHWNAEETDSIGCQYIETLESIVLRDGDKNDVDYNETKAMLKMRKAVQHLNLTNREHLFTLNGDELDNSGMVRIFNKSFRHGGRWYRAGAHLVKQRDKHHVPLPIEETRLGIKIDGCNVVEIDFNTLHPMLICATNKLDASVFVGDVYTSLLPQMCAAADRGLMKMALSTLLNSQSLSSGLKAIQLEINSNPHTYAITSARWILNKIITTFPELDDFICREDGYGLHLQFLDSCIVDYVASGFCAVSKPLIPVHDSFVCKEEDESLLLSLMEEGFRKVTDNKEIPVGVKIKRHTGVVESIIF